MGSNKMAENFKGYLKTKDEYLAAKGNKKIVIDFTASWCGPCKRIAPAYQKLAETFSDILFYKCDVDDNAETAEIENIQAMPTFKFYPDGVPDETMTLQGADESALKQKCEKLQGS